MVRRPLGNHHHGPDTFLVTSDTTRTDPMAAETGRLRELITDARFVLFDFDGPICRLFAGHSAELVSQDMTDWLERQGLLWQLTQEERAQPDPYVLLPMMDARHRGSDLVAAMEERLTQQELTAVVSAQPTAYADPLIRTWAALGARLAITSNNSARAVTAYLESRGLVDCFAPHIYGRTRELHRQKPDPHHLIRALRAMGAAGETALMIGDSPSDLKAAEQAGVPFLGYARNERKQKLLRDAGAEVVVNTLEPALRVLRDGGRTR
ncbi:HAD family hydrolase [Streptomyces sp. NPDC093984]|uniref:HAD family hydrolase n=1 Tax=Streptomyces sp. NPDC093984 TaxID=3366052 RepID=UPI0037FC92BE